MHIVYATALQCSRIYNGTRHYQQFSIDRPLCQQSGHRVNVVSMLIRYNVDTERMLPTLTNFPFTGACMYPHSTTFTQGKTYQQHLCNCCWGTRVHRWIVVVDTWSLRSWHITTATPCRNQPSISSMAWNKDKCNSSQIHTQPIHLKFGSLHLQASLQVTQIHHSVKISTQKRLHLTNGQRLQLRQTVMRLASSGRQAHHRTAKFVLFAAYRLVPKLYGSIHGVQLFLQFDQPTTINRLPLVPSCAQCYLYATCLPLNIPAFTTSSFAVNQ